MWCLEEAGSQALGLCGAVSPPKDPQGTESLCLRTHRILTFPLHAIYLVGRSLNFVNLHFHLNFVISKALGNKLGHMGSLEPHRASPTSHP